jgi:adenylate kinase family enzyme
MDVSGLRIVVSGPQGAGKTSLCRALGQRLNLPMLEEEMVPIFRSKARLRSVQRDPARTPDAVAEARKAWVETFFAWADQRLERQANLSGFVADRWEADLLYFWIVSLLGKDRPQETQRLMKRFRQQAGRVHYAILVTSSQPEAPTRNEAGLVRTGDDGVYLLQSAAIHGLIAQHTTLRCLLVKDDGLSVESRAEGVERLLHADMARTRSAL